jgi:hypothetical protein
MAKSGAKKRKTASKTARKTAGAETLPQKYVPKGLTPADRRRWAREIARSKRAYRRGKYHTRRRVKSHRNRRSPHLDKLAREYGLTAPLTASDAALRDLASRTGCAVGALRAILQKGRGAYYSSGSRPNQTAESWALPRLASALTGGKSSYVDRRELIAGCRPGSRPLKLMQRRPPRRTRKRTVAI